MSKNSLPNIIYILSDDLGYGDLGCFGQEFIYTPNIDRIAAEGIRFTDHYAGSSVCAPSRCVLMTGLHTGHCYVRDNRALSIEGNVPIPEETQTVAKLLKKAVMPRLVLANGDWGIRDRKAIPTIRDLITFLGTIASAKPIRIIRSTSGATIRRLCSTANRIHTICSRLRHCNLCASSNPIPFSSIWLTRFHTPDSKFHLSIFTKTSPGRKIRRRRRR